MREWHIGEQSVCEPERQSVLTVRFALDLYFDFDKGKGQVKSSSAAAAAAAAAAACLLLLRRA